MHPTVHRTFIVIAGSLLATWGVSLSILSLFIAIVLPSFPRLSPSTIQVMAHRPHSRSSPHGLRRRYHKPQAALSHRPIVSMIQEAQSMDIPFIAVHPHPLSVQSDMSSLHTSTTEGSIFASVNSSLFHHRGLSLKRAWNKRTSQKASFPALVHYSAPRSSYTRFIHRTKALFKLADSTPLDPMNVDPLTHAYAIVEGPVGLATSNGKKGWRKTPLRYADAKCSL